MRHFLNRDDIVNTTLAELAFVLLFIFGLMVVDAKYPGTDLPNGEQQPEDPPADPVTQTGPAKTPTAPDTHLETGFGEKPCLMDEDDNAKGLFLITTGPGGYRLYANNWTEAVHVRLAELGIDQIAKDAVVNYPYTRQELKELRTRLNTTSRADPPCVFYGKHQLDGPGVIKLVKAPDFHSNPGSLSDLYSDVRYATGYFYATTKDGLNFIDTFGVLENDDAAFVKKFRAWLPKHPGFVFSPKIQKP